MEQLNFDCFCFPLPAISVIIFFLNITMFLCKFNSPQVKQNLTSSIIKFVYVLPHKLSSNLSLRILESKRMKRKSNNCVETQASAQFPVQRLSIGNSGQNLRKSRSQSFLVLSNFAWLSYFWLYILSLIVGTRGNFNGQ